MPNFEFNARDAGGGQQTGVIQADSMTAVVDQLRSRGWLIVNVQPQRDSGGGRAGLSTDLLAKLPFAGPRSVHVELSLQQIAVMLRGGLTLLSALTTVAEQAGRASMRRVWSKVIDDVQEGISLSEAMSRGRCFPDYVVRLVRVGEQTGVLESVLTRGAQMMQARREAKRDMMTAMAYPAVVAFAAFGVTAYMVVYLIPKLGNFLRSIGKELPAMTQMLVDVADFVQAYGLYILGGIVAAAVAFALFYMSDFGRLCVDRLVLRVPVVGKVFRVSGTTTFSQSLSTLLRSGVSVLDSLVTVEQMHYNRHLAAQVQQARENIMQGGSLADSLTVKGAYMPLLVSMTAVGEESGSLDDVMEEVAEFHQAQLRSVIRNLSAWATPVVTVVVGGVVGFVYIAFFMALFAAGA